MTQQKIWFTSDNHYFHRRIREFCPDTRHGKDVNEMNELMIQKWNSQVGISDVVYMLGDFSFGSSEKTIEILDRLNGMLHLVKGNHDHWINGETKKYFESIRDYNKIRIADQKVVMFHYPITEWDSMHHGAFHLFGHVHGSHNPEGRSMDVGIDARPQKDMGLWEWDEIYENLKDKEIKSHHGKFE